MTCHFDFLIIGGGIAGVTCAESLHQLDPQCSIGLVSASPTVKRVTNLVHITKLVEDFDVEECSGHNLMQECPNVSLIIGKMISLDCVAHRVILEDGKSISYKKLCLCTGASPKIIFPDNPHVLGIRDTESVAVFQARLKGCRRLMVVGNGGIATELICGISCCEVLWCIKDSSITATFIDAGAAEFFRDRVNETQQPTHPTVPRKQMPYTISLTSPAVEAQMGAALGPNWAESVSLQGITQEHKNVKVIPNVEVSRLLPPEDQPSDLSWPIRAQLSDGSEHGVDLLISATGVSPNTAPLLPGNSFVLGPGGGLLVDAEMRTSHTDVYAAGDCCEAGWDTAKHWFQMRLWSQARQMAFQAAKCMHGHAHNEKDIPLDFCFELFTHVTRFFGFKVILLGLSNGQNLSPEETELWLRTTPGLEYVKAVIEGGRMQGCLLIGETDLEETFENLILNQLDLSAHGEHLLDPNIDIEDYFD